MVPFHTTHHSQRRPALEVYLVATLGLTGALTPDRDSAPTQYGRRHKCGSRRALTLRPAQGSSDFRPASTNVWDAPYPRVDRAGSVEIRLKAPEATKVRLNFWSGPKVDMVKQPDWFWSVTTDPLVPGLRYYTVIVDGAEMA